MGEDNHTVIAEAFAFDQAAGPVECFVARGEFKGYDQDASPGRGCKLVSGVLHGVYPPPVGGCGHEACFPCRVSFGVEKFGLHRVPRFRRDSAYVVVSLG